jgi:mRNA interferase RelE/StbE
VSWEIRYTDAAKADLNDLDGSQRKAVLKAMEKVSRNPLPISEGGYGKPLGNKLGNDLTGLCKIKLKKEGIRVVYALIRTETAMKIVVVAARSDNEVYDIAAQRKE